MVGTPAYMSPEQAEGRKVDARSDVFSLGSVLYEMVTGQRAFEGTSLPAVLASVLRDEPKPLIARLPQAPVELERILSRALRKEPSRRFQSMAELKIALEDLRSEVDSGVAITASVRRAPKRKRAFLMALLGLAAALGAHRILEVRDYRKRPTPSAQSRAPHERARLRVRASAVARWETSRFRDGKRSVREAHRRWSGASPDRQRRGARYGRHGPPTGAASLSSAMFWRTERPETGSSSFPLWADRRSASALPSQKLTVFRGLQTGGNSRS